MNSIPYQLSDGLFLESSNQLLPWYKNLFQITKKGGKPKHGNGKTTELFWESERVLGDLQVSITAMDRGLGIFFLDIKQEKELASAPEKYNSMLFLLEERTWKSTRIRRKRKLPLGSLEMGWHLCRALYQGKVC